eukprot:m.222378 g.222378  ORF g.222378 m.222378 type:complete len:83 (-) comp15934_c0_seq1:36-284(-)
MSLVFGRVSRALWRLTLLLIAGYLFCNGIQIALEQNCPKVSCFILSGILVSYKKQQSCVNCTLGYGICVCGLLVCDTGQSTN